MKRLACFIYVLPYFFRLPSPGCSTLSTLSTPCFRLIEPSYGFLLLVFAVPYLLSENRHFQRLLKVTRISSRRLHFRLALFTVEYPCYVCWHCSRCKPLRASRCRLSSRLPICSTFCPLCRLFSRVWLRIYFE